MLDIALFEPQIAPNTGNIIRLVANNGFRLHLIEPLGFDLNEKKLRRAGLDYADMAHVTVHSDYWSFKEKFQSRRIIACTTKGRGSHAAMNYRTDDILLFGAETHGLSPEVMADIAEENRVKIPMKHGSRSLNLSNAVAIISYEAWRQHDFLGAES
jgi:tRNA (cytidine/uridine-2'-O-)-methyltransferase